MPPETQREIQRAFLKSQAARVPGQIAAREKRHQDLSRFLGVPREHLTQRSAFKAIKDQYGYPNLKEVHPALKGADLPLRPRQTSLLESLGPYAATSEMILGKSKDAVAMISQYLKEHPETISGMVGPGSAGPVGMVFKRGIPLAAQIVDKPGGVGGAFGVKRLTENPASWWIEDAKGMYSLHPELLTRTGGPVEGRMGMTLNPDTGVAKLEFVGVSPEWRGGGFGAELLDSATRFAKLKGMTSVEINSLPGPVMGPKGKPVTSTQTGQDLSLTEWYQRHGFVEELDQPHVGGMVPMRLDLTKQPKGRGVTEYETRNRAAKRFIESLAGEKTAPAKQIGVQSGMGVIPDFKLYNLTKDISGHPKGSTVSENTLRKMGYTLPAPDVPPTPTGKFFVPEEVPREFPDDDPFGRGRGSFSADFFRGPFDVNIRTLTERIDAPEDVLRQYRQTGRLPEAWSSPSSQAERGAELMSLWQSSPSARALPPSTRRSGLDQPTGGGTQTDRGRPNPGESWSDYLARLRGR